MSIADGQEPPHVQHFIHKSKREFPGVNAITSCKNFFLGMAPASGRDSIVISVAVVNAYLLEDSFLPNKKKQPPTKSKVGLHRGCLIAKLTCPFGFDVIIM